MVRSPGFGSIHSNYVGLFSLAFTMPLPNGLSLLLQITRWIVLQKARRHPKAPTPCTHTISGSISLPFRGSFNLSLTVLVHYRSQNIFSLGTWSSQIQSGFLVSRPTRQLTPKSYPATIAGRKYKVSETWHTGLSPSLAELSNSFCSHR